MHSHVLFGCCESLFKHRQVCCQHLQDHFPFKEYFADAPGVLFRGNSFETDMEVARGCWRHLRIMFQELEECRAF